MENLTMTENSEVTDCKNNVANDSFENVTEESAVETTFVADEALNSSFEQKQLFTPDPTPMQVKMFASDKLEDLETTVNEWLSEHFTGYGIADFKFKLGNGIFTACIMYQKYF